MPIPIPMTAEEFEFVPDTDCRFELVRGEVIRRPFKVWRDAILTATISSKMWRYIEGRQLGVAGFGCGFVLRRDPDTVRAPEVAFIRSELIPRGEAARHFAYFAPDLAVEIVPPSGSLADLLAKADEYLAAGTRLTWTFDPNTQTLGFEDTLDGGDVLPGFHLPLRDLFGDE